MTQETKQEPPALPGEVWRGVHPRDGKPIAIVDTPDGQRAAYWIQMGSQWIITQSLPAASLIFSAAFEHQRAVAAAERALRKTYDATYGAACAGDASDMVRAEQGMGAARAALRALGVEP